MRVEADLDRIAVGDHAAEQFDLVGVDVGRCAFDGGGQVEDDRFVSGWLEHIHDRGADLDREIDFGHRKGFGRVFKAPVGVGLPAGGIAQHLGAFDGDVLDLVAAHAENDPPPLGRHGVVEVDDRLGCAAQALEAGVDQVAAGLCQDLDGNVVGHTA